MSLLAQSSTDFWGKINTPPGIDKYGPLTSGGAINFANNILKLAIVGAGLFAFINFISAGYTYLGAGGDVKKVTEATNKIWQSILGLVIVAGSFVLAAIVGWLVFKDPTAIISPKIYGPQ